MKLIDWLKELEQSRKAGVKVFAIGELMNLSNGTYDMTRRTIVRLKEKDVLKPIYRGLWGCGDDITVQDIFLKIDSESYISMESVLGRSGIIKSVTPDLHCVSPVRSKMMKTKVGTIVYHKFARKLCFGYDDMHIAILEKAFLDTIYFHMQMGDEIDITGYKMDILNFGLINKYISVYPKSVKNFIKSSCNFGNVEV